MISFSIARSSKGRTAAFEAVNRGSNPCLAATDLKKAPCGAMSDVGALSV